MAFAAWTLLHVVIEILHRSLLINTGRAKPNSFVSMRKDNEGTFIGRLGQSHANCVENLPLFATVVLVNAIIHGPDIPQQAWYFVLARLGQGVAHWVDTSSDAAITIRFLFFFGSMVLLISMGYKTLV